MSNYIDTMKEVKHYIAARTPLIILRTSERERAKRMLEAIGRELHTEICFYTDPKQVVMLNDPKVSADADGDPMGYMTRLFTKKRKCIFAFADVKKISEDTLYTRELVNVLYLAKESDSTLILITDDKVMQRIARFGMMTRLDLPDSHERQEHILRFVRTYQNRYPVEWDSTDILKAAALLRGFSEIQIENILSYEIVSAQGLFRNRLYALTGQKSRLYAGVSAIRQVSVDRTMQVSGLEQMKAWLAEKKQIFFASDEELSAYGLAPPKGILLAGVPGCGKSLSAKMIAKEWELPLFKFDIAAVYDKWMGESERKMRDALEFIDNVAPCVLWVDEIEKALSSSETSDTSQRILGQFLFWLQESGSRVFMAATANRVDSLPAELFRKGRFSEIFFLDLPDTGERGSALAYYAEKCLHVHFKEEQLAELTALSEGFSFSEIEYAVKETAQQLLLYGVQSVTMDTIRENFKKVVPIAVREKEKIDKIRAWGRERAVPAHQRECDEFGKYQ